MMDLIYVFILNIFFLFLVKKEFTLIPLLLINTTYLFNNNALSVTYMAYCLYLLAMTFLFNKKLSLINFYYILIFLGVSEISFEVKTLFISFLLLIKIILSAKKSKLMSCFVFLITSFSIFSLLYGSKIMDSNLIFIMLSVFLVYDFKRDENKLLLIPWLSILFSIDIDIYSLNIQLLLALLVFSSFIFQSIREIVHFICIFILFKAIGYPEIILLLYFMVQQLLNYYNSYKTTLAQVLLLLLPFLIWFSNEGVAREIFIDTSKFISVGFLTAFIFMNVKYLLDKQSVIEARNA